MSVSEKLVCITEHGETYCVWVPVPVLPRPIPIHDLGSNRTGTITGETIALVWGEIFIERWINEQEVCTA